MAIAALVFPNDDGATKKKKKTGFEINLKHSQTSIT